MSNLKKPINCVGKPGGRPREHDRDQIALDLIEWAKKKDSINLCKFCAYYDPIIPPQKLTLFANECPRFREAYECAKLFLGARREEMLNSESLHVKAYDLNAETYDYFLRCEKRSKAEFETQLKIKENNNLKSPLDEVNDLKHELMLARAKIANMQEAHDNKS